MISVDKEDELSGGHKAVTAQLDLEAEQELTGHQQGEEEHLCV